MSHQKKTVYTLCLMYSVLLFSSSLWASLWGSTSNIDIVYLTNITASKAAGTSGSFRAGSFLFVCSEQQEALALQTELSSDFWQIHSINQLLLLEGPTEFYCKTIRLTFSSQREGVFEDYLNLVFPSTTEKIPLKVIAGNTQGKENLESAQHYSDLIWHKDVINRMTFSPENYQLTIYGDTHSATFSIHPFTRRFTPLSFHINDLALCQDDSYCKNGKAWDRSHFYRNGRIARYSQANNNLSIRSKQGNTLSETSTICNSSTVGFEMKGIMTLTVEPSIGSEILGTIAVMIPAMYTREIKDHVNHPEINVPVCGGIDKRAAGMLCRHLGWGGGVALAPARDQVRPYQSLTSLISYECSGEELNLNECVNHCSNSIYDLWAEPQARIACHECRISYPEYSTYEHFAKGYPLVAGDSLEIVTEGGDRLESPYKIPTSPIALWTVLSPESIVTGYRHDLKIFQLYNSEFKQVDIIRTTPDKYFSHFSVNSSLRNVNCRSGSLGRSGKDQAGYNEFGNSGPGSTAFASASSTNSTEIQGSGSGSFNLGNMEQFRNPI